MTEDFDKEIDSILRQAARQEKFSPAEFPVHVDAEELSLFAENTLTSQNRLRVTEHLADCARCRKILSNVISLNSAEESEIISVADKKTAAAAATSTATIPWYKRIFAAPSLALSMGALVILLGGVLGFVLLQNSTPENASVARVENAETTKSSGPSQADELYSASAVSNTASSVSSNVNVSANTNSIAVEREKAESPALQKTSPISNNSTLSASRQSDSTVDVPNPKAQGLVPPSPATAPVETERAVENKEEATGASPPSPSNQSQVSVVQNQTNIVPDSQSVNSRRIENLPNQGRYSQQVPRAAAKSRTTVKDKKTDSEDAVMAESADESSARKTVGGKTFVKNQGVWYDTAYNQQKPVNVSRNSAEFKNLDAGLRTIANNINGVVVVVWKGKAYRIQ